MFLFYHASDTLFHPSLDNNFNPVIVFVYYVGRNCHHGEKIMKLSTKGEYGMRALLDLALHETDAPIPLKEISQRQEIPLQYLEHLITPLITAGLVRSFRGAKGGVLLARNPREIKLIQIIQTLEGSISPTECLNNPDICGRASFCVTRDVWGEMKRAMEGVLEATTLSDLVERHRKKEQPNYSV
jgi:Rrf2 family protein